MDFLPMTAEEMRQRGWRQLDVLLITGDAYVDHPSFGVPLLGRVLEHEGFRVGILAQPDWRDPESFRGMGRPRLMVGVASGAMDSMVNHYTAAKKLRHNDAYTPGGRIGARPNRAVIAYTAAVKAAFPGIFVVIGGLEASLRRLAHYDYWDDKVRRSVLVDSKADLLIYGMGEKPLVEIARRLAKGEAPKSLTDVRNTAIMAGSVPANALVLPSFEEVSNDTAAYNLAFRLSVQASGEQVLAQAHGGRWVLINPPAAPLTTSELDAVYALPFQRRPHPSYREPIPACTQIQFSITSHRGCGGGCAFCAIVYHQGRSIQSRSPESILREAAELVKHSDFRGTITDIGGPTANMYGCRCQNPSTDCRRTSCLWPTLCPHFQISEAGANLLARVRKLSGVRHLFVSSGVRCDLLFQQPRYLQELLTHHVGGLLKVAPETLSTPVATVMHKPPPELFERFLCTFRDTNKRLGLKRGIVPYLIAGHPGSTLNDMVETALFLKHHHLKVEQVQEFTPTPGTLATCLYYTGRDPFTGKAIHIPRSPRERRLQKALLLWHLPEQRAAIREALRLCHREAAGAQLLH